MDVRGLLAYAVGYTLKQNGDAAFRREGYEKDDSRSISG
jgi:hypothetical protein